METSFEIIFHPKLSGRVEHNMVYTLSLFLYNYGSYNFDLVANISLISRLGAEKSVLGVTFLISVWITYSMIISRHLLVAHKIVVKSSLNV